MIEVISHRGYWLQPEERNTELAFRRSFDLGFGTETDIRDHDGELVISHDPPRGAQMPLRTFLSLLAPIQTRRLRLALNIKADGLARKLAEEMRGCPHPWFVFDMSLPDTREQLRAGNPTFARMSEFEPFPDRLAGQLKGVWLDAFEDTWYTAGDIQALLSRGLEVCIVSPELHGRDPHHLWHMLAPLAERSGLTLCTDQPEHAIKLLGAKKS